MTDKEYREVGKAYLEPIKSVSIRINSLKEDLNNTMNDIVSVGAIDYSKERLSGGGTPTGIERCIIRLENKREAVQAEIRQLIEERENAYDVIKHCTRGQEQILLLREYIDGKDAKYAKSFIDRGKSQANDMKTAALIKVGAFIQDGILLIGLNRQQSE